MLFDLGLGTYKDYFTHSEPLIQLVRQKQEMLKNEYFMSPVKRKTAYFNMRKQSRRSAPLFLLHGLYNPSTSYIRNFKPSFVTVQPSLCWTWSETPKTGFLVTWLKLLQAKLSLTVVPTFLAQTTQPVMMKQCGVQNSCVMRKT